MSPARGDSYADRVARRRSPKETPAELLYPRLFDRAPVEDFPPPTLDGEPSDGEPWISFDTARRELADGNRDDAVAIWERLASTPDAEARVVLQAWRFLRLHGVAPPSKLERAVLGSVVELPLDGGHDAIAAYADGSARVLSHGGDAVVYEGGDELIDKLITVVLELAQQMADRIGTLADDADLPRLPRRHARALAMTPGGARFGQGHVDQLDLDPLAGEVLKAARLLAYELLRRATPEGRDLPAMAWLGD
jgi:hypothetical protein